MPDQHLTRTLIAMTPAETTKPTDLRRVVQLLTDSNTLGWATYDEKTNTFTILNSYDDEIKVATPEQFEPAFRAIGALERVQDIVWQLRRDQNICSNEFIPKTERALKLLSKAVLEELTEEAS